MPAVAAIALGSNLGDRHGHIDFAITSLRSLPGTRLIALSTIVETEAVGPGVQGAYLNAVAVIETTLPARDLLGQLLAIERERGRDRTREQRWGPRTLDLDLLLYGGSVIGEPGLTVPHPRLQERLFVLEPLAEVLPAAVVPGLGRTVAQLLKDARAATAAPPRD